MGLMAPGHLQETGLAGHPHRHSSVSQRSAPPAGVVRGPTASATRAWTARRCTGGSSAGVLAASELRLNPCPPVPAPAQPEASRGQISNPQGWGRPLWLGSQPG